MIIIFGVWRSNRGLRSFDIFSVVQFLPPTTSYLSIERIRPPHAGNYTCVASNQVASVSYTAALKVSVPPYFTEEPRDRSLLLGSDVEIPCAVWGTPAPNVTWEFAAYGRCQFNQPNLGAWAKYNFGN